MDMGIIAGSRLIEINPFFLDANGVTIKLKTPENGYPDANYQVGVSGKADGDTSGTVYTAVDNTTLFAMDPNNDDFTKVCTTLVNDLNNIFTTSSFNQNINHWDVSNVTDMNRMFYFATSFNQPLNNWNVFNVTDMKRMFDHSSSFNQPLNDWDVSNVVNFYFTFHYATNFNQPLDKWTPCSAEYQGGNKGMYRMFRKAYAFNQDLSSWNVPFIPSTPYEFFGYLNLPNSYLPNWGAPC